MKKYLALCGVFASGTFVAMLVLFAAVTPGYSHLTQAISELGMSNAPYAFLWNISGFGLVGVLILAFAWSLYMEFRTIPGGPFISGLTAISGMGFAGLGFFSAAIDFQPSLGTTLHTIMVMISYFTFIAVSFVVAITMRKDSYWKRWSFFSLAMGMIGLLSFIIPRSIPMGVSQRLGLGVNFIWLLVISYALYRKNSLKEVYSEKMIRGKG